MDSPGGHILIMKSMYESKHKNRSSQYGTVAEGRQKRVVNKLQQRKSYRSILFDGARNISPLPSPVEQNESEINAQKRRLQLQKWKEDKEKKKQQDARNKKKPFLVGAVRAPAAIDALPVVPKSITSTAGRLTRSQSSKSYNKSAATSLQSGRSVTSASYKKESFAPPNASFKPQLDHLKSAALLKPKSTKESVTFDPDVKKSKPPGRTQTVSSVQTQNSGRNLRVTRQSSRITERNKTDAKIATESRSKLKEMTSTQAKCNHNVTVKFSLKSKENTMPIQNQQSTHASRAKENTMPLRNNKETKPAQEITAPIEERAINVRSQNTPKKSRVRIPKSESASEEKLKTPPHQKVAQEFNPLHEEAEHNKVLEVKSRTPKRVRTSRGNHNKHNNSESPYQEVPTPEDVPDLPQLTPEQIRIEVEAMSPCVTVSRGKRNARNEMIEKFKDGYQADEDGDEKRVDHFRKQLSAEIKRLAVISDDWEKFGEENDVPEHIQELILASVGQTRLLISKKLQQFATLVEQCASGETRPGEGIVTITDLQGFWDMVYMQVENVDMRFLELSQLRDGQWASEEKPKPKRKVTTANNVNKKKPIAATSKLRATIEANRRALLNKAAPPSVLITASEGSDKSFDAGFFVVRSPVRELGSAGSRTHTPVRNNTSLLRDVLSSETRKASTSKSSAAKAMMRVSIRAKNLERDLSPNFQLTPVFQVNLDATPARSILKTPNMPVSSHRKSAKMVLFSHQDEEIARTDTSEGIEKILVTPEKAAPVEVPIKKGSSQRRTRVSRSKAIEQENIDPIVTGSEESSPRRLTRLMRRSILLEKQRTAELTGTVV